MLPYSLEAWFSLIARMNADLAVFVVIALLLGLFVLALTWWPTLADHKNPAAIDRRVGLALAAGWIAAGAVFHGQYLEPMFFGAPWLMALFIVQGLLLATVAFVHPLAGNGAVTPMVWLGRALMAYGLLGMPLVDLLLGPGWPAFRMVGLTPEAMTVFTCGWLLTRQPDWRLPLTALLPAAAGAWAGYQALALDWPIDWLVTLAAVGVLLAALAGLLTRARRSN